MKHSTPWNLSSEKDYRLPLRFAGLLYGEVKGDIIASSGVYHGEDVAKLMLAGANAVQVVSTVYKNGAGRITEMNEFISSWMDRHGFSSLQDFRGRLSRKNTINPLVYKRAQYIDMMLNSGKLLGRPAL
jgi:dihydroorotate dehydrogenase (fumarate)